MAVLVMLEIDGDTERLLAATADLATRLGDVDGLLVRITAPTEDGMVLFQLWDSPEARQANQDAPGHADALDACGILDLSTAMRSRAFEGAELRPTRRA